MPALWYFNISSICPHKFQRVKFVLILPCFVLQQYLWNIAIQPSVSCYYVWANSCCSGCSQLGEKSLWDYFAVSFFPKIFKCMAGLIQAWNVHSALYFLANSSKEQRWFLCGLHMGDSLHSVYCHFLKNECCLSYIPVHPAFNLRSRYNYLSLRN